MISYLGSLSVGAALPGADAAVSAGMSGINASIGDLSGRVAALGSFSPAPLTLVQQLTVAQAIVVNLQTAIATGLPVPDISLTLAAIAAQLASLSGMLAAMNAQLAVLTAMQAPLAVAGIHAYAFDGATDHLGSDLSSQLSGGVPGGSAGDHANAVALVTTSGAAWTALGAMVRVS